MIVFRAVDESTLASAIEVLLKGVSVCVCVCVCARPAVQ